MADFTDLDKTLQLYKVRTRWARSFVVFMWQHRFHNVQLLLCVLYFNCCCNDEPRIKSIETESCRFNQFNKQFVKEEYLKLDNKPLSEKKEYFTKLLEQKHYLLAFSVSNMLIRDED